MLGILPLMALVQSPQLREWAVFEGTSGPGRNKHVVLLAGDEEYRSEEALPQLALILSLRHGFKCTVLFSIGKDGTIDPDRRDNQPGLQLLKDADLVVMMLRFRQWPDRQMRFFDAYVQSGKPILALRTSTHAFDIASGPFERYGWQSKTWPGGFGRQILGETWVSHWGEHGKQATRGVVGSMNKGHAVLRGVDGIFVPTDVYEAHPSADSQVLMRGEVVSGMNPVDPPATQTKRNAIGAEQPVNDPMMPVVWTCALQMSLGASRVQGSNRPSAPQTRRILTTTMGSAQDLLNEGFRRLLVNGVYWLTGLPVPPRAAGGLVGEYTPSPFGFGGFKEGIRPGDLTPLPRQNRASERGIGRKNLTPSSIVMSSTSEMLRDLKRTSRVSRL